MNEVWDVAVFVGSLRKDSINRKVAHALAELAPSPLKLEIVEIGQLPLYNQDFDENTPQSYMEFRARVSAADAVLFVTPEYNRSVPAVLKNAIDVASRPYGQSAWNGKPGAVVRELPSAIGGFGANHHLRQSLVFLNVPAMPQPEAYLGGADKFFDASGNLTNDGTRKFCNSSLTHLQTGSPPMLSRKLSALFLTICLGLFGTPAWAALKPGDAAPDFTVEAALGGKEFTFLLAEALKKGPVVLYFYPKSFTSVCTVEAHEFAENIENFAAAGASVIGLSGDKIEVQRDFSSKECRDKFPVGADPSFSVIKAYDAAFTLPVVGEVFANRISYVISPDGKILYAYSDSSAEKHIENTLAAVKKWREEHKP